MSRMDTVVVGAIHRRMYAKTTTMTIVVYALIVYALLLPAAAAEASEAPDRRVRSCAPTNQGAKKQSDAHPWGGADPGGKMVDLTATISAELPAWLSATGLGAGHRTETTSLGKGDVNTASDLFLSAHTGTHVDAPKHFVRDDPTGIEAIPLDVINGPALVVEAFGVEALTAEVLATLDIPSAGVSRVLFRTDNTRRGRMKQTAFDAAYVGFTTDGAEWMVTHRPEVKAIGIDYLSIASLDHLVAAHVKLLEAKVVPIEGLVIPEPARARGGETLIDRLKSFVASVLNKGGARDDEEGIEAGWWWLHCAPLKLGGSDGAPARVWLTPIK